MEKTIKKYTCPCCGYNQLEVSPYKQEIIFPIGKEVVPPYYNHFGDPSYEVCDCCGYEFGNDDEPGTSEGVSFSEYLKNWIKEGCKWFDGKKKPENWDLKNQLNNISVESKH